jgi:hypothetical protein
MFFAVMGKLCRDDAARTVSTSRIFSGFNVRLHYLKELYSHHLTL